MATPPEQPWSNHEKNYLLAEIIKAAHPHPDVLFNIIRQHNIPPRWEDIPLPQGRSLNSCRIAFEDLRRSLSMHPMAAPMAPLTPTPISAQAATQNIKRPFPFESQYQPPVGGGGGREIRPKPIQSGPSLYAHPSPTEPPPKRKRGRPTKAETLAKAEAAAAAAGPVEVGGPATRPLPPPIQTPSSTTSSAPTLVAPVEEPKPPSLPPATRMPIAAMLTPTAREPKPASQSSSSSSGKRRRARSNKSEREETPVGRSSQRYESPYERMGPGSEDSPARTAVLRHREEPSATTSSAARTAPPERPAEARYHHHHDRGRTGVRSQQTTTIRTRPLPL